MAMRMTEAQKEFAREEGRKSFGASMSLSYDESDIFPMRSPKDLVDDGFHVLWEHWLKRDDITAANRVALDELWLEGYTEAYNEHLSEAMIPESRELHEIRGRVSDINSMIEDLFNIKF